MVTRTERAFAETPERSTHVCLRGGTRVGREGRPGNAPRRVGGRVGDD